MFHYLTYKGNWLVLQKLIYKGNWLVLQWLNTLTITFHISWLKNELPTCLHTFWCILNGCGGLDRFFLKNRQKVRHNHQYVTISKNSIKKNLRVVIIKVMNFHFGLWSCILLSKCLIWITNFLQLAFLIPKFINLFFNFIQVHLKSILIKQVPTYFSESFWMENCVKIPLPYLQTMNTLIGTFFQTTTNGKIMFLYHNSNFNALQ